MHTFVIQLLYIYIVTYTNINTQIYTKIVLLDMKRFLKLNMKSVDSVLILKLIIKTRKYKNSYSNNLYMY